MRYCSIVIALIAFGSIAKSSESPLTERIEGLEKDIRDLRALVDFVQTTKVSRRSSASLDPLTDAFAIVDTGLVPIAVFIEDVAPYADGTSVTLAFGNISSASISDISLRLRYGTRAPKIVDNELSPWVTWNSGLQSLETQINETFAPGRWTRVKVTLPAIRPDAFGYLSVSAEARKLHMTKP